MVGKTVGEAVADELDVAKLSTQELQGRGVALAPEHWKSASPRCEQLKKLEPQIAKTSIKRFESKYSCILSIIRRVVDDELGQEHADIDHSLCVNDDNDVDIPWDDFEKV